MNKLLRLIFVLTFASLLACGSSGGGGGAPPPPTTGNCLLNNQSGVSIDTVNFSDSGSILWGPDQLTGSLSSGSTFTITNIPPGTYDGRAINYGASSTYYAYLFGIPITVGNTYTITALSTSFTGTVETINNFVGESIAELYISPVSSGTWGLNQLSSPITTGSSLQITDIAPGSYDIGYHWSDGVDTYQMGISVSSLTTFSMTWN